MKVTVMDVFIVVVAVILVVATGITLIPYVTAHRSRKAAEAAALVHYRLSQPSNERFEDDKAKLERLSQDRLMGRIPGVDYFTHAFGVIPRVMPAGSPPWPVIPRGPDHMIQFHGTLTEAEVEAVKARFVEAVKTKQPELLPEAPPAEAAETRAELAGVFTPAPEPPDTCACGRPEGHLTDALLNGTPDDIDAAFSTGTFHAVPDDGSDDQ